MNRTKRQHHTPQAYLKHFADDNGQIMVYDRITQRTWSSHIKNAAVQLDLYAVTDADGNPSDVYETEWIHWFDNGIAHALRRLLDQRAPLTDADRMFVRMFLVFQHLRTPYMRETLGNVVDLMIRGGVASNIDGRTPEEIEQFIEEWIPNASEKEKEQVRQIVNDPSQPVEVDTESWIRAMLRHVPDLAEELETREWALVGAQGASCLTGDIPVALSGLHPLRISDTPAIVWPLSPKKLLLMGPPGSYNGRSFKRVVVGPDFVQEANQLIADAAARHIFWHPDTNPSADITLPVGPHLSSVDGVTVNPGEHFFDVISREFPFAGVNREQEGVERPTLES